MGVTVRLKEGRPLYIITVGMHSGTKKKNSSTHNRCNLDRLPKTADGRIIIALLRRFLQRKQRKRTRKIVTQHLKFKEWTLGKYMSFVTVRLQKGRPIYVHTESVCITVQKEMHLLTISPNLTGFRKYPMGA